MTADTGRQTVDERQRVHLWFAALFDPIINAEFSPQGVALRQLPAAGKGAWSERPGTGCATGNVDP